MSKLLNVLLLALLLCAGVWGANTIGSIATADLGSGTANSAAFLRGDKTWTNTLTGPVVATTLNITTSGVAANASNGSGQAAFATNSTGGTGQPTNTTQVVWIPLKIDGVTTYVAGFR